MKIDLLVSSPAKLVICKCSMKMNEHHKYIVGKMSFKAIDETAMTV